eukprot:1916275-Ditylum_brightwellii.AAC.1
MAVCQPYSHARVPSATQMKMMRALAVYQPYNQETVPAALPQAVKMKVQIWVISGNILRKTKYLITGVMSEEETLFC